MKKFLKKWFRQFICEHEEEFTRKIETRESTIEINLETQEREWTDGKAYKSIFFNHCKKCGRDSVSVINWRKLIR